MRENNMKIKLDDYDFEESMRQQLKLDQKTENEIRKEIKKEIIDRSQCMIDSYKLVLNETAKMFRDSQVRNMSDEQLAKRADMFWHLSMKKIDKEQDERDAEIRNYKMRQQQMIGQYPPMVKDGSVSTLSQESPCAKRARESAKKITELENEISKKDK
jgi:hypothetical protein